MRAVAYARYSSDNQREESIDAQLRAIKEFCKKENIDLINIYIDEAKSATTDNREQFLNMINDSIYQNFNAVIVHKLDRFARNRYDSAFYKKKLKDNNVRVISVLEHLDDSPESIILESVLEGMSEYYSKNLSREVMKGMKETALQCKHTGGIPPLGYNVKLDKTYEINEEEAKSVRNIFNMYLNGFGYGSIANTLNSDGYKTKLGKSFTKNSIRDILLNEKYSGVFIFNRSTKKTNGKRNNHTSKDNDKIIRIDGGMPAIISKEDYSKTIDKINANARGPRKANVKVFYMLSGKIECGECKSSYTGAGFHTGRGGKKYYIYSCTNKKKHLCTNKSIRKELLEEFVIQQLKEKILNRDAIRQLSYKLYDSIIKLTDENKSDIIRLKKKESELKAKINRAMDLILDGSIAPELVNNKLNLLNEELKNCSIKINELNKTDLSWIDKDKISAFLEHYKNNLENSDDEIKKKILDVFLDKIIINANRIDILFKIKISPSKVERDKVGGGEPFITLPLSTTRYELYKNS